jgi:hypothetical protein
LRESAGVASRGFERAQQIRQTLLVEIEGKGVLEYELQRRAQDPGRGRVLSRVELACRLADLSRIKSGLDCNRFQLWQG